MARKLIMLYLPCCAWQTYFEVLTQLEQLDEDIKAECVKVCLTTLANDGRIERRLMREPIATSGQPFTTEYKAFCHRSCSTLAGGAGLNCRDVPAPTP